MKAKVKSMSIGLKTSGKKIPLKGLPAESNGAPYREKKSKLPPSHDNPVKRAEVGGVRKQRRNKVGNEGSTMAKGSLGFNTIKPKAERIGSTQKTIPRPKRGNI